MEIYASSRNFSEYGIDQEEWEHENQNYITKITPPDPSFEYTLYTICLVSSDFNTPPSWLKTNTHFIEYDLSMNNIEAEHNITSQQIIEDIDAEISKNNCVSLSLTQIQNKGGAFNVDSYQTYMSLSITSKDLNISIINDYYYPGNCYSYPFFKSILFNNPGADLQKCCFIFVNISINSNSTIAFKVNFGNGSVKYYDYSGSPM
ncbi:MAG: hypothetical protein U0X58_10640 [Flavobacteriaceae bacterium]